MAGIRRRFRFWRGVVIGIAPKALNAILGHFSPAATLLLGAVATVVSYSTFGLSLVTGVFALATILATIAEAVYHEWDRWAPHDPPNVTIERWDWPGHAGVKITNRDPGGVFKMKLMGLSGPKQVLAYGPIEQPWPWDVIMQPGDLTVRLERGEPHSVPLVYFESDPQRFEFRVSRHVIRVPAESNQEDIAIALRLYRIHPDPSALDFEERISWRPR
jgi:hypothetical protein